VILLEGYRRLLIERFPYVAVHLVGDDRIDVLAVIGTRRDPESIQDAVTGRVQGSRRTTPQQNGIWLLPMSVAPR
jgi:hypothetical protein